MVLTSNTDSFYGVRYSFIIIIFLILTTWGAYYQVKNYEFVNFDDDEYVSENEHLKSGPIRERISWCFTTSYANNWFPLTWLSHLAVIALYGLDAGKHHLANVILHITNALLVFVIFRKMTGALWQSGFIAALFALHPLHVESVAWVTERKDVLSAFFFSSH